MLTLTENLSDSLAQIVESIKQTNGVLKNIQGSVMKISDKINDSNIVFEEQVSSIEEITAVIENLNQSASVLKRMASEI